MISGSSTLTFSISLEKHYVVLRSKDSKQDVEAWWPKLKIGGLIAGDDYHAGYVFGANYTFGVKDAVDEFVIREKNHRVQVTIKSDFYYGGRHVPNWYVVKCSQ